MLEPLPRLAKRHPNYFIADTNKTQLRFSPDNIDRLQMAFLLRSMLLLLTFVAAQMAILHISKAAMRRAHQGPFNIVNPRSWRRLQLLKACGIMVRIVMAFIVLSLCIYPGGAVLQCSALMVCGLEELCLSTPLRIHLYKKAHTELQNPSK